MKNKRKLNESDDAVVGIVVTVLLIGLILAVTVMINNVYVPQWLEQEEISHMDTVSNQFNELKHALDLQTILNDTTSVASFITLGSREIPFFDQGRTFGSLSIVPDSCIIRVNYTYQGTEYNTTYATDSITYRSGNSYYTNQKFIYQAGALILEQDEENVLLANPSLMVSRPDVTKNISFVFVDISGIEGKMSVGGFGNYAVHTRVIDPSMQYVKFTNVSKITIETDYLNAWNTSLRRSFLQPELSINYTANIINDKLEITFHEDELGEYYYDFYIRTVDVPTEIGYGLTNMN